MYVALSQVFTELITSFSQAAYGDSSWIINKDNGANN